MGHVLMTMNGPSPVDLLNPSLSLAEIEQHLRAQGCSQHVIDSQLAFVIRCRDVLATWRVADGSRLTVH